MSFDEQIGMRLDEMAWHREGRPPLLTEEDIVAQSDHPWIKHDLFVAGSILLTLALIALGFLLI